MTVEERRRMALHRAIADAWGQEIADTLFELVAPSGHEIATRADIEMILEAIEAMDHRWQEQHAASVARWQERQEASETRWQEQLAASEARWQERQAASENRWSTQLEAVEHRLTAAFERGLRDAITTQTRTLVFSQLGAVVVIAGLAFGISA